MLDAKTVAIVLRYENPNGGFRALAPNAEQVQVCSIGPSGTPSCTKVLFLSSASHSRVPSPRALFTRGHLVDALGSDDVIRTRPLRFE